MQFSLDIWVRGDNHATTAHIAPVPRAPQDWTDEDVAAVLAEMLRALDRARHPETDPERPVALRGFSWIVNPYEGGVLIALELSIGAVVAGPFPLVERELSARIARVVESARASAPTVH